MVMVSVINVQRTVTFPFVFVTFVITFVHSGNQIGVVVASAPCVCVEIVLVVGASFVCSATPNLIFDQVINEHVLLQVQNHMTTSKHDDAVFDVVRRLGDLLDRWMDFFERQTGYWFFD